MKTRGKNGAEIVQYLHDNADKIAGIKFTDEPAAGKVTFVLFGKMEVSFDWDLEAQIMFQCALTGTDYQAEKMDLSTLKKSPVLTKFKDIAVGVDEVAAKAKQSPALPKRRSSDLWVTPTTSSATATANQDEAGKSPQFK